MLTGKNGILKRATEAKEKTKQSTIDEQRKMAQAEAMTNIEKTTYKGVTLPEGFAPTKIAGEDSFDDGLVITDAKGNEYVWVEVPKTDEVYQTAGLEITDFTVDEYSKIESDLHTYTDDYREGTTFKDIYYESKKDGWFKNENEYNELKQKMLKSIYQNGGFWVGRYEAGIEENRTKEGLATTMPLSKANLYPYNYVTIIQAKNLAEQVESGSYMSSLMFGVQWDLILKYIETKGATKQENLKSDSKMIGNYYDNYWNITNVSAKYSTDNGKSFFYCPYRKKQEKNILLTTGADTSFALMNIYDIAGNVWEWTLEKTSDNLVPCAHRGGEYNLNGSISASYRNTNAIDSSFDNLGFRITLY